jgi:hypothetical protein
MTADKLVQSLKPNQVGARMRLVWLVLAVTTALLIWRYPEQGWVLVSKLNRIALGAALGVALDRAIFWYARPDADTPLVNWMYRRVALMVAGMLCAALAL